MEAEMTANQQLILAMYAAFAVLILIAGYAYKSIRDYRERRRNPKLPFPTEKRATNSL
jgi:hypothetical protein